MVDANEKDKSSPGKDATEKDEVPVILLDDMEEEEDDDEDEYDDDDEEEEEEEEEAEEEDEEEEEEEEEEEYDDEESEEERVNDGGNAVVVVKNEGLETNKENAVKEDGKKGEEPKSGKKLDESSKSKEKRPRSRNTKKNEQNDSGILAANGDKPESSNKKKVANGDKPESSNRKKAANGDKPESSNKKKALKRVASMGMVFMCSSKTKADCFRYKVLGLPESKKDQVLKIYQGMRLFLFDVDLRLMYGIFKAAGPGGYNIEPKAFKSEFPSQVRFTVLDDCLPLAEENFKSVLKENYYSRNKFEGLLKSEQVKKLCKLFLEMNRGAGRSRSAGKSRRTRRRRTRPEESHRHRVDDRRTSRTEDKRDKRKRWDRDEERRPRSPPPREKRRYTDYDRPPIVYDREPPVSRYLPPQPTAMGSPVRLYTYERQPIDAPPYIRDHVPEPPAYRVVERDRDRDRDPYLAYSREPPPLYRDTLYTVPPPEYHLVSREYHHPPVPTPEYHIPGGSRVPSYRDVDIASDYRSVAALPEYRSRTHYKY